MSKTNRVRLIVVGIVLMALSSCATDRQGPIGSAQAAQSACEWVSLPLGIKWTTGGIDSSLIEIFISSSLEGVDNRCDDINGMTPLQGLATSLDDQELPVIRYILTQGASIDLAVPPDSVLGKSQTHYAGATALHFAADGNGRTAVLEMLIDFGGSVAARTNAGATPLHFAAAGGDPSMVELLLERGSDIRTQDERGWTPLHYAASKSEHVEVVIALVDLGGADPEATTNSGQTPYDLILENPALKDSEAVYLLEIR